MEKVKVEILIDPSNAAQVKALCQFFEAVGNITVEKIEQKEKPKTKTPPPPANEQQVREEVKDQPTGSSEIKIEDVRALLSKKVNDHRTEIKTKLTELGANNVTSLEKEKYEEFYTFLNNLK